MSHDSYYEGDAVTFSTLQEGDMDLECGNDDCLREQSVVVEEEYSHGTVTWQAAWTCSACGESNSREGWFDPNDNN
jgi:hypothetical protein